MGPDVIVDPFGCGLGRRLAVVGGLLELGPCVVDLADRRQRDHRIRELDEVPPVGEIVREEFGHRDRLPSGGDDGVEGRLAQLLQVDVLLAGGLDLAESALPQRLRSEIVQGHEDPDGLDEPEGAAMAVVVDVLLDEGYEVGVALLYFDEFPHLEGEDSLLIHRLSFP